MTENTLSLKKYDIKDIYTKYPQNNPLCNALIDWYNNRPIYKVAERQALSKMAMEKHPLIKGREYLISKGILELNEIKCNKFPELDLCELNILIARGNLDIPSSYQGVEEVFIDSLRFTAYGRVDYWAPSLEEIKRAREIVIIAYKEYYNKLIQL